LRRFKRCKTLAFLTPPESDIPLRLMFYVFVPARGILRIILAPPLQIGRSGTVSPGKKAKN
jgi:hypothetical protein